MSLDKITVSLDDFIGYILKKWKLFAAIIFICVLCSVGIAAKAGGQILIPTSEEYIQLKEEKAYYEEYIDHSIVMQMDPTNIYERTIFLSNVPEVIQLQDYVEGGDVFEKFEEDIPVKYLLELVSWDQDEENSKAEIIIRHCDREQCGILAEYVAGCVSSYDETIEVFIGSEKSVADEAVSKSQLWWRNRLDNVKGLLEHATAGCTIEVNSVVAGVFGIVFGGFLAVVILYFKFLLFERKGTI